MRAFWERLTYVSHQELEALVRTSKGLVGPAAMFAIVFSLMSCAKQDKWAAIGYPNKNDLTQFRNLGDFETLESCRAVVRAWRDGMVDSSGTDYECGKNCAGAPTEGSPAVCEATER